MKKKGEDWRAPDAIGSMPPGTNECRLLAELHTEIGIYYTFKIARYGATPLGVDWSCAASQDRRFLHLLQLCDFSRPRSLNDVGCGYGALLSYLERCHGDAAVDYLGTELSEEMVRHAEHLWGNRPRTQFLISRTIPRVADYCIASGIFNVKLEQPVDAWEYYIARTLDDMHRCSRLGFAVNFIAEVAEGDSEPTGLYRISTERWFKYCSVELVSEVELVVDEGLREFTLLVRKN